MTLAPDVPVESRIPVEQKEMDLLVACARTTFTEEQVARIEQLVRGGVDWDLFFRTSVVHRLVPLVFLGLSRVRPGVVPPAIMARFKGVSQGIGMRNLLLSHRLTSLLDFLSNHGIPGIPYKGPLLAAGVYGNLGFRQYGDLDILVHRQDFRKAKALLLSEGFRQTTGFSDEREESLLQTQLHRESDNIVVEIQWGFAPDYFHDHIDLEDLWKRQTTVQVAGRPIPSLAPEDLILILCVHGAKHVWMRLSWICDVAEFLRAYPDLDWHAVCEQARRLKCERMFHLGLYLAWKLLDADLPPGMIQRVGSDPRVVDLADRIVATLRDVGADGAVNPVNLTALHLRMIEGLSDRFQYHRYMLWKLFQAGNRDRAVMRLPRPFAFLHRLLRPFRLIWEYGIGGKSPTFKEDRRKP